MTTKNRRLHSLKSHRHDDTHFIWPSPGKQQTLVYDVRNVYLIWRFGNAGRPSSGIFFFLNHLVSWSAGVHLLHPIRLVCVCVCLWVCSVLFKCLLCVYVLCPVSRKKKNGLFPNWPIRSSCQLYRKNDWNFSIVESSVPYFQLVQQLSVCYHKAPARATVQQLKCRRRRCYEAVWRLPLGHLRDIVLWMTTRVSRHRSSVWKTFVSIQQTRGRKETWQEGLVTSLHTSDHIPSPPHPCSLQAFRMWRPLCLSTVLPNKCPCYFRNRCLPWSLKTGSGGTGRLSGTSSVSGTPTAWTSSPCRNPTR